QRGRRLLQGVSASDERRRGGGGRGPAPRRAREDQEAFRTDPARQGAAADARRRAGPERRAPRDRQEAGRAADRLHGLARAEPEVRRLGGPRAALDHPRGRAGVAALSRPRLSAAAGARSGRRQLVLLDRPQRFLVLGDAYAGPDPRETRDRAERAHGAAQDRAGHRRGAGPSQEPDRRGLRLPGGFGPPARLAAGPVRADRRLRDEGLVPDEDPPPDRR